MEAVELDADVVDQEYSSVRATRQPSNMAILDKERPTLQCIVRWTNLLQLHGRRGSPLAVSITKRFITGAMAGLAGALGMQWFRSAWNANHGPESGVFGLDREADVNSIRVLSQMLGRGAMDDEMAERIALAAHYVYGAAAGVAYAFALKREPRVSTGFGTALGMFVWLFGDEIPIAASGVSNPRTKTGASHLAALVAHALFGATTEATRRLLERA